jgi:hypothetical protein
MARQYRHRRARVLQLGRELADAVEVLEALRPANVDYPLLELGTRFAK